MVRRAGDGRVRWVGIGAVAIVLLVGAGAAGWVLGNGVPRGSETRDMYCDGPDVKGSCAASLLAGEPPILDAISDNPSAPRVALSVTQAADANLAHVSYLYSQPAGEPEDGSIVRLYAMRSAGDYCLLDERAGRVDIALPGVSSGRFRVGVIPRSTMGIGHEYLSDSVDVLAQQVYTLPDIRSGGVQDIKATSLDEAKQIALAAGTWNPAAGTLGNDAVTIISHYPPADRLCRG